MRTKRYFAALAATILLAACGQDITAINYLKLGTNTGTSGNCTWTATIATQATLSNGNLVLKSVGDTASLKVIQTSVNNCMADQSFRWTSNDPSRVAVVKVDPTTGRITAIAAGIAQICAIGETNSAVTACINVTVSSIVTTCTVTGVTITGGNAILPGNTVQLTAIVTSNPSGCAVQGVTWSATGAGTVDQNGLVTAGNTGGVINVTAVSKDDPNMRGTFTVTVGTTGISMPATLALSNGFGCSATASLPVTVTGIASPVVVLTSSNPSVATVAGSGASWTVTRVGVGTTNIVGTVTGTSLTATTVVTVGTAACNTAAPTGITIVPTTDVITVGASKTPTSITVTYADGHTAVNQPGTFVCATSSAGVLAVNSATCQYTGVASGTAVITASAAVNSVPVTPALTATLSVTVNPASVGSFTFNPTSACFSTIAGSSTTQPLSISTSGIANGSVITVTSSNTGLVTVSPATFTVNGTTPGSFTLTNAAGTTSTSGTGNVTLTVSGGGGTGSLSVQVLSTACPGTGTTIDYTPAGGTSVTTPVTLTSVCTTGGVVVPCSSSPAPFWTSNHPEILDVVGNGAVVNGFHTGVTATVTRIAPTPTGVVITICVQQSVSLTNPSACHQWP